MAKSTIYDFIRDWFDFSFENPDLVSPTHTAMYLWLVELNNRMGWAEKFGSPAQQTMDAIGLSSYKTYGKVFKNLCDWEFIILVRPARNQFTSCVIALAKNTKAGTKALDIALAKNTKAGTKALPNQEPEQYQSSHQSSTSIIRPTTNKPIDQIQDIAKIPEISPSRGSHCPTWQAVQECFHRLGHPDKAFGFFEYWEGLNWMKGITPIINFSSFANRWVINPISQAQSKPESTGGVIMLHVMTSQEESWSQKEYEQYCNNSGSGYKFLRYAI